MFALMITPLKPVAQACIEASAGAPLRQKWGGGTAFLLFS